jgi:hypothetical protein
VPVPCEGRGLFAFAVAEWHTGRYEGARGTTVRDNETIWKPGARVRFNGREFTIIEAYEGKFLGSPYYDLIVVDEAGNVETPPARFCSLVTPGEATP